MLAILTERASEISRHAKEILGAFFNIQHGESVTDGSKKVAETSARRIVYALADYWLTGLSISLVIVLKALGYEFLFIFLAMLGFDVAVAGIFIVIWLRTGKDVTLGEDYRRAIDLLHTKSRMLGRLAVMIACLKASVWDGPEYIIVFFHKELKTDMQKAVVLLILSAFQAVIWAFLFSLGYDSISDLIEYVWKNI